jgi:AmmeMemoRadiSam system protein A
MFPLAMFQLTESDQRLLLQIARTAVDAYLSNQKPQLPDIAEGALAERHGIFVSIHRENALRGCIGNVHPAGPLYRSVAECAIAAAVADSRFMPLMAGELANVDFEISVLSAPQQVRDILEIEIGKHGLLISKKEARGLLLPQVAATYGWDRERFLCETCVKAGLKPDAWKEDATIESFNALVFDEKQFQLTVTA